MAGQEPATAGHGRDAAGREVPLAEAAELFGTTQEAVRKRLRRGSLQGGKRDGEWWVRLAPDLEPAPNGAGHGESRRDTTPEDGGTERDAGRDMAGQVAVLEARLEEVERHRDWLRDELAERNAQLTACLERLREAHVLLAQRPALAAAAEAAPETRDTTSQVSRPWWRRWWPGGGKGL